MKPQAGWYSDPQDPTSCRLWDGEDWTAQTKTIANVQPPLNPIYSQRKGWLARGATMITVVSVVALGGWLLHPATPETLVQSTAPSALSSKPPARSSIVTVRLHQHQSIEISSKNLLITKNGFRQCRSLTQQEQQQLSDLKSRFIAAFPTTVGNPAVDETGNMAFQMSVSVGDRSVYGKKNVLSQDESQAFVTWAKSLVEQAKAGGCTAK